MVGGGLDAGAQSSRPRALTPNFIKSAATAGQGPAACGYHFPAVTLPGKTAPASRRRALAAVLLFGLGGGALSLALKLAEYRFLVVEHSVEIYIGLSAALAAALGIWLGRTLTRKAAPATVVGETPAAEPFSPDPARLVELGITPRELEILGLIASGLSNREIAERLFVSENTVKTHSSRLFDKLGAKRRTQAVQLGRAARLIP